MGMLNPYQQYAQNQVTTATQEDLTLMLYKGAVKFISLAKKSLNEKTYEEANNNIIKAQNIYYELLGTLNYKYDISYNLAALYNYIIKLLVQANTKKDQDILEEALGMAKEFSTTWEEAIKIYRCSQASNEWVK